MLFQRLLTRPSLTFKRNLVSIFNCGKNISRHQKSFILCREIQTLVNPTLNFPSLPPSSTTTVFEEYKEDLIFIRNHPAYRDLYYQYDPQQIASSVKHQAVKDFIELSMSSPDSIISDLKYQSTIQPLLKSLTELNDEELLHALFHLRLFQRPSKERRNEYAKIWGPFDEECIQRGVARKNWRASINYVISDIWAIHLLGRYSNFHWVFLKICIRKLDNLPREKFVRLCQTICKARKLPEEIKLYNLEFNVPRILAQSEDNRPITMQELSLICAVFYKEKYPIQNPQLVSDILKLVTQNSKTISNSSLNQICKAICLTLRAGVQQEVTILLETMIPEVNRFNLSACAGLLLLARKHIVQNLELMSAVAARIEVLRKEDIKSFEIPSEFEWLANAYEVLDYPSSPAFATIFTAMKDYAKCCRRQKEAEEAALLGQEEGIDFSKESVEDSVSRIFQHKLIPILNSLGYGNVYPVDLISIALSPKFLLETYGRSMYQYAQDVLTLDMNVENEIKDYTGSRVTDKARGFMSKRFMRWMRPIDAPKMPGRESFCKNVYLSVVNILGDSRCAHLCNILPHSSSIELVICTTPSGDPIPVPESFKSKLEYEPKILLPEDLKDEIQYHVVFIHHVPDTIFSSNQLQKPIGPRHRLQKQVEQMGYTTYNVSYKDMRNAESQDQFNNYLASILSRTVKIPAKLHSDIGNAS